MLTRDFGAAGFEASAREALFDVDARVLEHERGRVVLGELALLLLDGLEQLETEALFDQAHQLIDVQLVVVAG